MAEQLTDEWKQERAGFITGSRISDIFANADALTRDKYLTKLAFERLSGKALVGGFTSARMQQGIDLEPEAKERYTFITDRDVVDCGFIPHPEIDYFGTSPDGFVQDDGLAEFKNRDLHIHKDLLLGGKPPREAVLQMYAQMSVTRRTWCDYVSYNPSATPRLQMVIFRVPWHDGEIEVLENKVKAFNMEVNQLVEKLRTL